MVQEKNKRKQSVIYATSNMIAGFGSQTYAFAISFYILQMTGSSLSFAIQLICNVLPRTLAAPFIGELVDRYSKRSIILLSQIASLVIVLALATNFYFNGVQLPVIYLATGFLSLTAAFTSIGFTAAITELFEADRIQQATSINQVAISSAAIVSPIIGGILYGFLPLYGILLIFVILFFLAVLLNRQLVFKQAKEEGPSITEKSMLQNIKQGFTYTKAHAFALKILLISLTMNFIFAAFEVGYAYSLIDQFAMPSSLFGITESGFAIGMLGTSILLAVIPTVVNPMKRIKHLLLLLAIAMIATVLPYYYSFSLSLLTIYFFTIMLLIGVAITSTNTMIMTVLQQTIEDEMKGRFFGLLESFALAVTPLSFILFGFVFDLWRADQVLLFISLCFLLVSQGLLKKGLVQQIDRHLTDLAPSHPNETSK